MSFEQWLQAKGFDAGTITDAQRAYLMGAWKAETDPEENRGGGGFDETMKAIEAENARVSYIQERAEAFARQWIGNTEKIHQVRDLAASAIADKKTDSKAFDLALLRLDRSAGPVVLASPSDRQISGAIVEAAVCRKAGLADLEKHYPAHVLEASERQFRNGLSLMGLLHHSAQRNGWRGLPDAQSKSFLRAAFGMNGDGGPIDLYAGTTGPSTYSVPTIVGNIANKFLKMGFLGVDSTWSRIAYKRSVNDFKTITTARLNGALIYRTLAPGGEIKHGTLSESTYTNRASTYAIMLGITREDMINDDIGAFTELSKHMGRGAGLKINDLFWTVFLNNSSFFASGNANVSTGTGSALATADGAAINAAEVVFINQTDPNGYPVAIMPKIMLVPPTLANTARRWMGSFGFTVSGTTGLGDSNVFAGRYNVESSPYMENSAYTGYSTAAWYLLANPDDEAVIEGVALNNRWEPQVDTAEPDFNQLGMAMRGYIDVGFAFKEPRGGVRSAGS